MVVRPSSTGEAAALLGEATRAGRGVRICGGGTKSGHLPSVDIILSTEGLRGIRTYARDDLYVTVGAGTPLVDLQAELARDRMWVPMVAPQPAATVGGIVSTNWNAPLRMRYGALRDLVLAATVAMADGRVIRAGRPVVKNVAGYDLPKVFVGAYGTLGLLADVTLKLAPLPRARMTLAVPVPDLARGLAWGARLLPICLVASALLLCDARALADLALPTPYALIYTAEGLASDVSAELEQARHALLAVGAADVREVAGISGSELWAGWLRAALADERPTLRLGVAADRLPALARDVAAKLPAESTLACDLANGLLYAHGATELAVLARHAVGLGGYGVTLDGGPGSARWGHAPDALDLMRALKARWNPGDLLNPGASMV